MLDTKQVNGEPQHRKTCCWVCHSHSFNSHLGLVIVTKGEALGLPAKASEHPSPLSAQQPEPLPSQEAGTAVNTCRSSRGSGAAEGRGQPRTTAAHRSCDLGNTARRAAAMERYTVSTTTPGHARARARAGCVWSAGGARIMQGQNRHGIHFRFFRKIKIARRCSQTASWSL